MNDKEPMSKRVLVIGSEGFIGQHITRSLRGSNYKVFGMDQRAVGSPDSYVEFRQCDLMDLTSLEECIQEIKPEFVINLGAKIDLLGKDLEYYAANYLGVTNLIHAIDKSDSVQRCIFTSTQLVQEISSASADNPNYSADTLYGESKALGEKAIHELDGGCVEWCIVRPTTVWGTGMSPHYQRLFQMIKRGVYFHIGTKPLMKSYGFVGNISHQYKKLLEAPIELIHRQTFYLADYEPISLQSWLEDIRREIDAPRIPVIPVSIARILAWVGDIIHSLGIKGFPFNSFRLKNILTEYQFDLTKTREVCGEMPISYEDAIRQVGEWLNNDGIV